MIVLDVFLMASITFAIVGLLSWSIWAQHRDAGGAPLRIRHRLHVSVKLVPVEAPRTDIAV